MVDHLKARKLIDDAISTQKTIFIRYRDYHNKETERMIVPSEWEGRNKIRAYCLLRNEERHFRIENIIDRDQPVESQAQISPWFLQTPKVNETWSLLSA